MESSCDRRALLRGGLGVLALAGSARALPRVRSAPPRTLVLIQLTGGNDGLSCLVPRGEGAYARARQRTLLGADEVLPIDAHFGLHPAWRGLREIYGSGKLALFPGAGYPDPNRSHFRSMDIWHAADARGRGLVDGWVGRSVARLEGAGPLALVHFGPRPPFSLSSTTRAPLCITPALLGAGEAKSNGGGELLRAEAEQPSSQASAQPFSAEPPATTLAFLREVRRQAEDSAVALRAALARSAGDVSYPGSPLAHDLCDAARLIHGRLGVRVCSLELDGFDTHKEQRPRHDRLMAELDGALTAFLKDLERSEEGREAVVLLFSEFGRRVEENASGGTDHGAAGLTLVLGTRVRGGLHGEPPSLEKLADGDLVHTTDFRSVYGGLVEHVFGLSRESVLGAPYPELPFL